MPFRYYVIPVTSTPIKMWTVLFKEKGQYISRNMNEQFNYNLI